MTSCKKYLVPSRAAVTLLFIFLLHTCAYEKTLRKIVRDQFKMVQKPFSGSGVDNLAWKNETIPYSARVYEASFVSGYNQGKTVYRSNKQKTKSTIISSIDNQKSMKNRKTNIRVEQFPLSERLVRNPIEPITPYKGIVFHPDQHPNEPEDSFIKNITVANFYQVSNVGNYFQNIDDKALQNAEQKLDSKADEIFLKDHMNDLKSNNSVLKGFYPFKQKERRKINPSTTTPPTLSDLVDELEEDKEDILVESVVVPLPTDMYRYNYNGSANPFSCNDIQEAKTDIDVQEKFCELNIEPIWAAKTTIWNQVFHSRYEALMRNKKWPPLRVILLPRSHVDSIWRRNFDQYHNNLVHKIISNIVKKLQFYTNMTFTWNEVSHLSYWWSKTTPKNRAALRKLVKSGRLEITTGCWVETDEATAHIFGMVHSLIEGHQWLKQNLNMVPKVGWLTNSVTHSPTMPYILSASGIPFLVITNLHFAWQKHFAEYQYSDFLWVQNWDTEIAAPSHLNDFVLDKIGGDRLPKHSVLTHYLQFNSAGFKACGPDKDICISEFNFAKSTKIMDINSYNVKEKAELLLEQYSKTGTISSHNVVIAPVGGNYRYDTLSEFDYQYNNYRKLADFINSNKEEYKATVDFGTVEDYFNNMLPKHKTFPTLKGDFLNFADLESGTPAYWTGFFTTRPFLKILLRRLQATLRTTEILYTFAVSYNSFEDVNTTQIVDLLDKARVVVARLTDRNVVAGTLSVNALRYVHTLILNTAKDCWSIQEVAASLLTIKPPHKTAYLQKYVYRDGEFISVFRSVVPGDQIYVFNSMSHERTEIVELVTRNPNIRILDHVKKDITIQVNPIWKYSAENVIKISRKYFKIVFAIVVPPMTLELYKIKETYDSSFSAAMIYCLTCVLDDAKSETTVFPFTVQPLQKGDVQLESYKHRLIFDEVTGFLKTVIEKETNIEKTVIIDYGAFRSSDVNAGMYLFNTNVSKPLYDTLMSQRFGKNGKIVMIVSGHVTTELSTVYGRLVQHTTKIFNLLNSPLSNAIYLESKIDYEASPKNRETEMFLTIQTDVSNGNPPQMVTDNNGFQYTTRILNISRRVESNMYPMTSLAFIQDKRSRVTVITGHAQGVTALQEGQLVLMLDRRVLFSDGRGIPEGLADSSTTTHRHYLLLENFVQSPESLHMSAQHKVKLPSLDALYLSHALSYLLDVFIINKDKADMAFFTFLPLIKVPFPCDVSVLNYRALTKRNGGGSTYSPNSALLVLHRQSYSCQLPSAARAPLAAPRCDSDMKFSLEKILRHAKLIYKSNLSGTAKGTIVNNLNQVNFPPMELITMRIHF